MSDAVIKATLTALSPSFMSAQSGPDLKHPGQENKNHLRSCLTTPQQHWTQLPLVFFFLFSSHFSRPSFQTAQPLPPITAISLSLPELLSFSALCHNTVIARRAERQSSRRARLCDSSDGCAQTCDSYLLWLLCVQLFILFLIRAPSKITGNMIITRSMRCTLWPRVIFTQTLMKNLQEGLNLCSGAVVLFETSQKWKWIFEEEQGSDIFTTTCQHGSELQISECWRLQPEHSLTLCKQQLWAESCTF